MCFSLVNLVSFENVKNKWTPEIRRETNNVPIILVGTKLDLREENRSSSSSFVPFVQGIAMMKEINAVKYIGI